MQWRKTKSFFGENGLTSTSANYCANKAKELYSNLEEELNNVQFYDESISLLGTVGRTQFATGKTEEFLRQIPAKLSEISALKSLCAWLREAIKARKILSEELDSINLSDWCNLQGIDYPEQPVREHVITEAEYYGSLNSIKERNAYYTLETKCAVLGKYIHENGKFNVERKKLSSVRENQHVLKENGRDTLVIHRNPSIQQDVVDDVFFSLQEKHREYQAALHSIQHKCELAIEASQLESDIKFRKEYEEYSAKKQELMNQFTEWKHEQMIALQALKIVIPDNLKPVYEKVCSLGK